MSQRELDEKQEKKVNLFDFMNDISHKKQYLLDDDTKTVYNQFMVNRAFMQHLDTVLLANELNKMGGVVTDRMHHDFLFHSVDPKPRYGKWAKKNEQHNDVVKYIMKRYSVNNEVALEHYLRLMTEEEIKNIEISLKAKGGKK